MQESFNPLAIFGTTYAFRDELGGVPFEIFEPPPPPPPPPIIHPEIQRRLDFEGVNGIVSQFISSFGRNPTQQIYTQPTNYNTYGGAGQPTTTELEYQRQIQSLLAQQNSQVAPRIPLGGSVDNALSGVLEFIQNNIVVVAAVGIGALLLFKEPPRKR